MTARRNEVRRGGHVAPAAARPDLPVPLKRPDDPPNYLLGRKGKRWGLSLLAAYKRGAVIVTEEYGVVVTYDPLPGSKKAFRPWRKLHGKARFDHRECIPTW